MQSPNFSRRDLLRTAAGGVFVAASAGAVVVAAAAADTANDAVPVAAPESAGSPVASGIRAFKLYTGSDRASHARRTIDELARTDVIAIHFKETPAHSSGDWHDSPELQYVITLSGTLEFTTRDGETFLLRPGDILLSEDNIGTGHKWRLIDDQPWRRAYVVLKPGARDSFVAQTDGVVHAWRQLVAAR